MFVPLRKLGSLTEWRLSGSESLAFRYYHESKTWQGGTLYDVTPSRVLALFRVYPSFLSWKKTVLFILFVSINYRFQF
jgi:hypothetical protein